MIRFSGVLSFVYPIPPVTDKQNYFKIIDLYEFLKLLKRGTLRPPRRVAAL
jgi:hypothetical protein